MRQFLSGCIAILMLASAPVSVAQTKHTEQEIAEAKRLFQEGEQFFNSGEFTRAFDKYKAAYYLSDLPLFLFNMALCQFRLKNWEESQHLYEAFLHAAPDSAQAPEAKEQLKKIEEELAKVPAPALTLPSAPTPEKPKNTKLFIFGGVGAILLGGTALTLVTLSQRDDFPSSQFGTQPAR